MNIKWHIIPLFPAVHLALAAMVVATGGEWELFMAFAKGSAVCFGVVLLVWLAEYADSSNWGHSR